MHAAIQNTGSRRKVSIFALLITLRVLRLPEALRDAVCVVTSSKSVSRRASSTFPHTPDDHKNKSPEGRMEHEVKWVQINAQVVFSPRERLKENARKCKMSVSQLINEMITSTQIDISPGMPAQMRDLNS